MQGGQRGSNLETGVAAHGRAAEQLLRRLRSAGGALGRAASARDSRSSSRPTAKSAASSRASRRGASSRPSGHVGAAAVRLDACKSDRAARRRDLDRRAQSARARGAADAGPLGDSRRPRDRDGARRNASAIPATRTSFIPAAGFSLGATITRARVAARANAGGSARRRVGRAGSRREPLRRPDLRRSSPARSPRPAISSSATTSAASARAADARKTRRSTPTPRTS